MAVLILPNYYNPKKYYFLKKHYPLQLTWATVLLGIVLLLFLIFRVSGYSTPLGFAIAYRNGQLGGTFFYTFLITKVIILIFTYLVIFGNQRWIALGLMFSIIVFSLMFLGLRIYLIISILTIFLLHDRVSYKMVLTMVIIIVILLAMKLFVNDGKISMELLSGFFIRHRIDVYLNPFGFDVTLKQLFLSLPVLKVFTNLSIEWFFYNQYAPYKQYIGAGNYSGLAISLPVVLYNIFGWLAAPILYACLMLFKNILTAISRSKRILTRLFYLYLIFGLTNTFFEDYYGLNILVDAPIVIPVAYFVLSLRLRREKLGV